MSPCLRKQQQFLIAKEKLCRAQEKTTSSTDCGCWHSKLVVRNSTSAKWSFQILGTRAKWASSIMSSFLVPWCNHAQFQFSHACFHLQRETRRLLSLRAVKCPALPTPICEMRGTTVCHGSLKSSPVKVDENVAGRSHIILQDRNAILVREKKPKTNQTNKTTK